MSSPAGAAALWNNSFYWIANILSFAAAFVLGPVLWKYTVNHVSSLTYQTYGSNVLGMAELVWFGLCYLLVFFGARATIGTSIVMGGLAIAIRFFK